jgi:hypothetical protein
MLLLAEASFGGLLEACPPVFRYNFDHGRSCWSPTLRAGGDENGPI